DATQTVNLQAHGVFERGEEVALFARDLARAPVRRRPGQPWLLRAVERRDHATVGVAVNKADPFEAPQQFDRLRRHRTRADVAAADDEVDVLALDLLEHRFQRGQVAVDVRDDRHPHAYPRSLMRSFGTKRT